jgi:hypothetical protein
LIKIDSLHGVDYNLEYSRKRRIKQNTGFVLCVCVMLLMIGGGEGQVLLTSGVSATFSPASPAGEYSIEVAGLWGVFTLPGFPPAGVPLICGERDRRYSGYPGN